MRLWRVPLRYEGALGIGRPVVSFSFRCEECKLCSRWHWPRYSWNDQWSWWIAWVSIFFRFALCSGSGLITSLECTKKSRFLLWRFVTFVVLTADRLVGRDDGHVCRRKRTFPLMGIRNEILDIWWMWTWIQQITLRICWLVVHTGALVVAFDRNFWYS